MVSDWPSRGGHKAWVMTLMVEEKKGELIDGEPVTVEALNERIRVETRMEIYLIERYREEFEKAKTKISEAARRDPGDEGGVL